MNHLSFTDKDKIGHVWAAVWCSALAAGIPSHLAKELADIAQSAAEDLTKIEPIK